MRVISIHEISLGAGLDAVLDGSEGAVVPRYLVGEVAAGGVVFEAAHALAELDVLTGTS
jgi:hypothetical protein